MLDQRDTVAMGSASIRIAIARNVMRRLRDPALTARAASLGRVCAPRGGASVPIMPRARQIDHDEPRVRRQPRVALSPAKGGLPFVPALGKAFVIREIDDVAVELQSADA